LTLRRALTGPDRLERGVKAQRFGSTSLPARYDQQKCIENGITGEKNLRGRQKCSQSIIAMEQISCANERRYSTTVVVFSMLIVFACLLPSGLYRRPWNLPRSCSPCHKALLAGYTADQESGNDASLTLPRRQLIFYCYFQL
jgi:hypothetical protein